MDPRSEAILAKVHPALAGVLRAASQAPQPFLVIQGLRTMADEARNCAAGASKTMHSRHLPNAQGFACAVDVDAVVQGHADPTFAKGREEEVFGHIAAQVKAAAQRLGVMIQWGGDPVGAWTPGVVSHFRDWGHFQLPWAQYP